MRRRLVLIALLTLTAALIPLTGMFYLALSRTLERDARTLLQSRVDAVVATIDLASGSFAPRDSGDDAALDSNTWVFAPDGRVLEHPTRPGPADAAARSLAHVRRPVRQDVGDTALLAVPVRARDGQVGTVVASLSRLPYEHAERTALIAGLTLDLVVLAALGLLTWTTVSAALAPVAAMTAAAADWGAHDTSRRFRLGPATDELTGLAATLDDLLERLSASLGHERRLTAEIAHELRTPVTRIRTTAEVGIRARRTDDLREALAEIVTDSAQLSDTIDILLRTAATQQDDGVRCDPAQVVADAITQVGFDPGTTTVTDHRVSPTAIAVESTLAVRALIPLLDNAHKYGQRRTDVDIHHQDGQVRITVRDDGPGLTEDEAAIAFDPGMRGRAAGSTPGAGLGLPLARRLARSAGGDVLIAPSADAGAKAVLTLPGIEPNATTTRPPSPKPGSRWGGFARLPRWADYTPRS